MTNKMVDPKRSKEDYGLGEALHRMMQIFLQIDKETDPEHYAWFLKWNEALKKERLARERRLKIESQEPERK